MIDHADQTELLSGQPRQELGEVILCALVAGFALGVVAVVAGLLLIS